MTLNPFKWWRKTKDVAPSAGEPEGAGYLTNIAIPTDPEAREALLKDMAEKGDKA